MARTLRVPPAQDTRFLGQPVGLATLFTTELWERFSYYGMRAILVLYLVDPVADGGLGMSTPQAVGIYAVYSSMVWLLAVPGGWLSDRLWGPRKTVLIGAFIIAGGHYVLAVPTAWAIWPGLGLVALGTGFLKPNISAMVGGLYDTDSDEGERRDAGFSIYYMGINLGGFIAPFVCGFLAADIGWHAGFAAAGVGMTIALVVYIALAPRTLGTIGKIVPNPAARALLRKVFTITAILIGAALIFFAIDVALGTFTSDHIIWFLTAVTLVTPLIYFRRIFANPNLNVTERSRMRAYIWIFIGAVMFWMIFDQGGSLLNIFAEDNTSRFIGSYEFPASWLQSVDPLGIIIFAPLFALMWMKLGHRAPSLPAKFALSILLIGMSFILMSGLGYLAEQNGTVQWEWLVMVFLVQVMAELLLSPTGLSASTQLAPRGMESQVLALWFLATAVGDSIGGLLANLQPVLGNAGYFALLGSFAIVLAAIFTTQIKRLRGLMVGVH
jgi:proton-dependent oligopeptide transporter, POT family